MCVLFELSYHLSQQIASRLPVHVGLHLVPSVKLCLLCQTTLSHPTITVNLVCLSANAAIGRRPVSFVFGGFEPTSGWTPGWSFFVGLLPVSNSLLLVKRVYTFVGCDV